MTPALLRSLAAAALGGLTAALSVPASSQGFSGTAETQVRQLRLRPVAQDTVSRSRVTEGPGGLEFEGFPVVCTTETLCIFYRSLPVRSAAYLAQDVELTTWGLGVQGLSGSLLLRGRTRIAGDLSLPGAGEGVDAVLAYLELNRDRYRIRAGRQRMLSGLGATGFDGVALLYDPGLPVRVEAYGGRSLAPGLSEPRHRALRGLDDLEFVREVEAVVVGAEVAAEPRAGSSVALRYQRELWWDRAGLLSERASLTGRTLELRPVTLSGAADYDFAFGRVGKAHLRAQLPLAGSRVLLEATARRYVPYFELWTIWGYFDPVGHHELMLQGSWNAPAGLSLRAAAGYRGYRDTDASVLLRPLEDRSWRAELGGRWRYGERWTLDGGWTMDGPVGAFLSSGDAMLSYRVDDRLAVQLRGMAARQIEEFRLGHGTVLGAGGGVEVGLRGDARLAGGVDLFRQTRTERPAAPDWNQLRSWLSLRVGIGRDPGAAAEVAP